MAKRVIGSFAAGAAFMYFADPNRGRRRRAIARDKCMSGLRDLGNQFDKAGRDFQNRAQGVASLARSLWNREDVDGPVLEGRVSATIGRAVSHPHAIHVRAEKNGRIVLEGPVLRHDLDYLIKRVTAVPGVNELVSRLEVFEEPRQCAGVAGRCSQAATLRARARELDALPSCSRRDGCGRCLFWRHPESWSLALGGYGGRRSAAGQVRHQRAVPADAGNRRQIRRRGVR